MSKQEMATDTDFYERVYSVVRDIPVGMVTTYGAIAAYLGAKRSSRLVGYALSLAAEDMATPCHRVVNRNGELTGRIHFASPTMMREMLESEAVTFKGDAVRMEKHFWDPAGSDA